MDALRCQFFGLTVEALLTRLRIAVIVVDQDAIVRWVNSAFCDMFATTASHVVDASVTRLLTPSSRAAFAAAFAGRKAGESTPYELATLRPDGTTLHVTVLPSPIYDDAGRFLGGFAVVNDRSRAQGERHRALVRTVQALATTIERRDAYTAGHQRQVANLSVEIGRRLQLDGERLEGLYLGALVHDVGKVAVPAELLTKPTALSEAERSIMRSHASIGQDILEGVALPWPIAAMVGQHHEHLDGSGYPLGLKGDEIIQEARIIAVADVLEAMSEHRPYRRALQFEAALCELAIRRGSQLDPVVVDTCLAIAQEHSNDAAQLWPALERDTVVADLAPSGDTYATYDNRD